MPASLGGLPVAVPAVAGLGEPAEGYPWPWSVHEWLDGEPAVEGRSGPEGLAGFVKALRSTEADGPPAYRGGPLTALDRATRDAVEQPRRTDESFDAAALDVWTEALDAPHRAGLPGPRGPDAGQPARPQWTADRRARLGHSGHRRPGLRSDPRVEPC
jgi:aminoglycoside phosphotransferase (APT) family kinase protein